MFHAVSTETISAKKNNETRRARELNAGYEVGEQNSYKSSNPRTELHEAFLFIHTVVEGMVVYIRWSSHARLWYGRLLHRTSLLCSRQPSSQANHPQLQQLAAWNWEIERAIWTLRLRLYRRLELYVHGRQIRQRRGRHMHCQERHR